MVKPMDHKGQRFEVPPERLERWLDRAGPFAGTTYALGGVAFEAPDGSRVECEAPFPPLRVVPGYRDGFVPGPLLAHALRHRRVGVLVVRLGGYGCGVFDGRDLVASKVGSRLVHGRHRAGGQSQRRFERRRGEQGREALRDAADTAVRVLVGELSTLEAVVLGGDHTAIDALREDRRLAPLFALATERFLGDVPDPRLSVVRALPDRFRATLIRVSRA